MIYIIFMLFKPPGDPSCPVHGGTVILEESLHCRGLSGLYCSLGVLTCSGPLVKNEDGLSVPMAFYHYLNSGSFCTTAV